MNELSKSQSGAGSSVLSAGRVVFACLFAASLVFFALFGNVFLNFGRLGYVNIDSPALAEKDARSRLYIVDSGRKRITRVGTAGKVDFLMAAKRYQFSEIYGLAVNDAGEIYVIDTIRDGKDRRIRSEIVRRYPQNGRVPEEIFRIDHEIPTFHRVIAGLKRNAGGGISFVTLEDQGFVLHSYTSGEKDEITYKFPMADEMFNSFDVGGDGLVFFTTRRGEVYKADRKGLELIFASDASIPWDAAVGDDGVLFFTDLKRRGVYSIMPGAEFQIREPESVYDDPDTIWYRVSAKNGLIAVSEFQIIDLGLEEEIAIDELKVTGFIFAMRLCSWFSVLIILAGCVWGALSLAGFLISKKNFVVNLSAAVIAGILLVTVVFSLIVTRDVTNRMTREIQSRMTNVAELVAMQIPKDAFARLNSVSDYMNDDYVMVGSPIERIMSRPEYLGMYCVLYKILDGAIAAVFESDNDHGIVNYPYDWPLEGSDEMEILLTGQNKTFVLPSWVDGGVIFSLCPIFDDAGESIGLIEIGTDLAAFRRENMGLILNLFLNVISMSIAMIIVTVEFLVFVDARRKTLLAAGSRVPVDMVRGAVFLVFFVTNISVSFLPIYARGLIMEANLSAPFSIEFLIAVPISADVLLGAIAALLGDWFVKKFGVGRLAKIGGFFIVCGAFLAFAFYNFFALAAGFAVCGFGCGLILFLANLQVAGEDDTLEKDRGFAGIAIAMNSGINSGVVFGAFLTNWLSHQAVLGAAALVSLILLAFSGRYMTKLETPAPKGINGGKEQSAAKLLCSPKVLLYFLTLLGPAIISGYFIIYLFPIVGFDFGISESNIGYAFLLNSLVVIFFSSMLTNICSKKFGKTFSLSLWTLIYAVSFAIFAYFQNIPVLLIVLVLMGFADCFGQSLSTSYFTELPEVQNFGQGKALGIYNVVENLAQTVGPFVFSYALHLGLTEGLLQIAGGLAVLSLIFMLLNLTLLRIKR